MLRGFILSLALLASSLVHAQRSLPDDMDVAVLKTVDLPYLKVSKGGFSWTRLLTLGIVDGNAAKLQITRFTKIHDENDRFIPMGRLLNQTGKAVAFKYNEESRLVREIWILTDAEADRFIEHAKKQKKGGRIIFQTARIFHSRLNPFTTSKSIKTNHEKSIYPHLRVPNERVRQRKNAVRPRRRTRRHRTGHPT